MEELIWQVGPWSLIVLSASLALAAILPPFHPRRMFMATLLCAVSAFVIWAQFAPALDLPSDIAVVSECEAYRSDEFETELREIRNRMQLMSSVSVVVLPTEEGNQCVIRKSSSPESVSSAKVGIPANFSKALDEASRLFSTSQWWLNWRARRVVLIGLTNGPLKSEFVGSTSLPDSYSRFVDKFAAAVDYLELRRNPDRAMVASLPVRRATPRSMSATGLRVDISGVEQRTVRSVELTIKNWSLDSTCKLVVVTPKEPIEIGEDILDGTVKPNATAIAQWLGFGALQHLLLTIDYQDPLSRRFFDGTCDNSWWSFSEVSAVVTLKDGVTLRFKDSFASEREDEPELTLFTPDPKSVADISGAFGWDTTASNFIKKTPNDFGLEQLLLRIQSSAVLVNQQWPFEVLWPAPNKCWFKGLDDIKPEPNQARFRECLERTERLAVISPTFEDVKAMESLIGISQRLHSGKLNVLIADQQFSSGAGLPDWASGNRFLPVLTAPILMASTSTNALLTRGINSPSHLQEGFLDAFTSSPFIGSSENGTTCSVDHNTPAANPSLIWVTDATKIPRQQNFGSGSQPDLRVRGLFNRPVSSEVKIPSVYIGTPDPSDRFGTAEAFKENNLCDHPLKRIVDAITTMEEDRLYVPGRIKIPRAAIIAFNPDVPVADISQVENSSCAKANRTLFSPSAISKKISQYLADGGSIVVQPIIPPAGSIDLVLYEDAIAGFSGTSAIALEQSLANAIDSKLRANYTVLAPVPATKSPAEVGITLKLALDQIWSMPSREPLLWTMRPSDGMASDRRSSCIGAGSKLPDKFYCAFEASGSGAIAASATVPTSTVLTRISQAPEFYVPQRAADLRTDLISGNLLIGDGSVIREVKPLGRGSVTTLGYSPFARDQLAASFNRTSTDPVLQRGQCYQFNRGTKTSLNRGRFDTSVPGIARDGGMKEVEYFAHRVGRPVGAPVLDEIIDRDERTGAFTMIVFGLNSKDWNWKLEIMDKTDHPLPEAGRPFLEGSAPATLAFQSYDPRTGQALIRVIPRLPVGFTGALSFSFDDREPRTPVIVPVEFPPAASEVNLTDLLTRFKGEQNRPSIALDISSALVLALAFCTIALFTPLARSWSVVESLIDRLWKHEAPETIAQRAAPLFSLQSALAEWGAHPGSPAATRNAGLPAGFRGWRSGDSGRSILQSTLYPLVGSSSSLPPIRPNVRLKTASEAISVLILVEGNGALLSPPSSEAPSKMEFAAAFAAFLAGAVTLSYGKPQISVIGHHDEFSNDPLDLAIPIVAVLKAIRSWVSPDTWIASLKSPSLIYFICDGLSANGADISQFAATLSADGCNVRVAAIISKDDARAATLRRDSRSGRFEDDSETHPTTFLERRDERLVSIASALEKQGGKLAVFDSSFGNQETLQVLSETGFLL